MFNMWSSPTRASLWTTNDHYGPHYGPPPKQNEVHFVPAQGSFALLQMFYQRNICCFLSCWLSYKYKSQCTTRSFYWDGLLHNQLQLGGFIAQTVAIGKVYCTSSCNPPVAPGTIATSAALSLVLLQIKNLFGFLQKSLLWWKSLLRNNCVGASERQQVILEGWCRDGVPQRISNSGW